jgi:vacuolar protein sorting-associated protein 13A/C
MQLQVIRNLELSIRNIHIVYEDKSTKPNHPFAFGITLNYISFHVTNFLVFNEIFIRFY